jgi:hypothetical protein
MVIRLKRRVLVGSQGITFIVACASYISEVEMMGGRQKTTLLNPVNKEEKKKVQQQQKE